MHQYSILSRRKMNIIYIIIITCVKLVLREIKRQGVGLYQNIHWVNDKTFKNQTLRLQLNNGFGVYMHVRLRVL